MHVSFVKDKCGSFSHLCCCRYIFVFMWTPAMQAKIKGDIPFGLVFATFMVACMAGSSIFSVAIGSMKNEKIGVYALAFATGTFFLMALAPNDTLCMFAFLLFEMTVGLYFPMMGTMKSVIVPESKRAAIYNLYRIPLNFIVLFSLLTDLTPRTSFFLCTGMLAIATFLQTRVVNYQSTYYSTRDEEEDLEKGDNISKPLLENTESNDNESQDLEGEPEKKPLLPVSPGKKD